MTLDVLLQVRHGDQKGALEYTNLDMYNHAEMALPLSVRDKVYWGYRRKRIECDRHWMYKWHRQRDGQGVRKKGSKL